MRFDKQILSISIHFTKRDIRKIQIDGNTIISRNTMFRYKLHQNNLTSVNKERTLYTIGKMLISISLMCAYDTLVILTKII